MAPRARVAACLASVLGAALLFATARSLDAAIPSGQLGPGFWPRVVLIGLALACGLKLLPGGAGRPSADAEEAAPAVSAPRLGLAIAGIFAYVVATPLVGFPLATAGFIAAFMLLAGARSGAIAATAVGGTLVLLYTFIKLVYLPFPKGAGPFERVTLGLYRALGIF
jgi:putative tricarboxylic transport membrane protein